MPELSDTGECPPVRVGAVAYLNARPLNFCIRRLDPGVRLIVDLPSRLADGLAAGRLDVAMIPSIEYFRNPGYTIVSDACVACHGAVRSVRLYGRVAAERIRTLALDEGSRTSAALVRILLKERFNLEPQIERLPVGASVEDSAADAVLLIGDRAMLPPPGRFAFVWDMGEEWSRWTGLPFVFAMWIARHRGNGQDVDLRRVGRLLAAARDEGVKRFVEIARAAAPALGVPEGECLSYLRDNLDFWLGPRQREGLARFCELAGRHGLAPAGAELVFDDHQLAR